MGTNLSVSKAGRVQKDVSYSVNKFKPRTQGWRAKLVEKVIGKYYDKQIVKVEKIMTDIENGKADL